MTTRDPREDHPGPFTVHHGTGGLESTAVFATYSEARAFIQALVPQTTPVALSTGIYPADPPMYGGWDTHWPGTDPTTNT